MKPSITYAWSCRDFKLDIGSIVGVRREGTGELVVGLFPAIDAHKVKELGTAYGFRVKSLLNPVPARL